MVLYDSYSNPGGTLVMPDYDAIERQAEALLAKVGITQAPVNAIRVANRLGYSVHAATFRDPKLNGRILARNGNVRIDVNASNPPSRRRYTIAHEIGHAQLHNAGGYGEMEITDRVSDEDIAHREVALLRQEHEGPRPLKEVEADRFAAALLMPREWVTQRFEHDKNARSLARFFEVSEAALEIRLKQLSLVR